MANLDETFDEMALWRRVPACRIALATGQFRSVADFYLTLTTLGDPGRTAIAAAFKFDEQAYLGAYGDVRTAVEAGAHLDGLDHWLRYGRHEERIGARRAWRRPYFDRDYYLGQFPDVQLLINHGLYNSPEEHWLLTGQHEVISGRRPIPKEFDETRYLADRPATAAAVEEGVWASGFDHWLSIGRSEARRQRVHEPEPPARSDRTTELSEQQRVFWDANGFIILRGALDPDQRAKLKALVNSLWERRRTQGDAISINAFLERPDARTMRLRDAPARARDFPYKIHDAYLYHSLVREIALDSQIAALLRALIGGVPTVVGSLNIERGSHERFHTDILYRPGPVEGATTSAWFALEDVRPDAGPPTYYARSHKIPRYVFSDGGSRLIEAEIPAFDAHMNRQIDALGMIPAQFLAKAGDVMIRHELLYHGDAAARDLSSTRQSLVVHYSRADLATAVQATPRDGG